VNYLAHAWVLGEATPGVVLGAALPDLMGAFDRRAPRLAHDAAAALERAGERELARGVRAHHAADVSFHALPAFKEGCAELRGELAKLGLERVRGFFAAHLLLEMLLDAALMEEDPGLAPRFYEAMEKAPVARAAELCAGADAAEFAVWIGRFTRSRFLLDYASDEKLVHRLEQVLSRARQTLGEEGALRLRDALPALRLRARDRLPGLTEEPRAVVRDRL
jgi:hypothetical protein